MVEWKRTVPRFDKSNSLLKPQSVIRLLSDYSNQGTIVVTDVGQHQIWTGDRRHYYLYKLAKMPFAFATISFWSL